MAEESNPSGRRRARRREARDGTRDAYRAGLPACPPAEYHAESAGALLLLLGGHASVARGAVTLKQGRKESGFLQEQKVFQFNLKYLSALAYFVGGEGLVNVEGGAAGAGRQVEDLWKEQHGLI